MILQLEFADDGALLTIMTRWHVDDLLGRFIECCPNVRVLRYPAIAEHDEQHRRAGEALFPELKPLDFLQERRKILTEASWEALYQQNPFVVGGGIFPIEKLKTLSLFDRAKVVNSVRYIDKAGTEDGGAWTAGVLIHSMNDGTYVIEHVFRGQWSALERERKIKFWADHDRASIPGSYEVWVEQEPGSGGKESAENTIRQLAGHAVYADRVTGKKEVRAEPFAAQVQGGNVKLVSGPWHADFFDELEAWPNGRYKDQVDACSGAFARLSRGLQYDMDALARGFAKLACMGPWW